MTTWTLLLVACVMLIAIRLAVVRSTTGPGGWLSATLVVLFLAMVLQVPAIITAVDGWAVPGFAGALSNAFIIPTLALAYCAFHVTVAPDKQHVKAWIGTATAIAAAILVSFVVFGSNYAEFTEAIHASRPVPPVGVYAYIYVLSLLWIAVNLTVTGMRLVLRGRKLTVRISLVLLAFCSLSTIVYGVARLSAMVTYQFGLYVAFLHGPLIGWLMRLCIVTLLLGLLVAVFGPKLGVDRWQEKRSLNRTFQALFPLWSALRDRYPEIVLDKDSATPKLAVYRRMIEIWDGLLLLRPHMDQTEPQDARGEAKRIAAALAASRTESPAAATPGAASNRTDEVAWLTKVSLEFSQVTR